MAPDKPWVFKYPMDFVTPRRHVATKLEEAGSTGLTLEELAKTYNHPNHADIGRVERLEHQPNTAAAVLWLVRRAADALSPYVRFRKDEHYELVTPFERIRIDGPKGKRNKSLTRTFSRHKLFGDPFNPMSGRFSQNIRRGKKKRTTRADIEIDEELRASMRELGWLPDLPAIQDKDTGVTIVGHRRLEIAAELGIEPVIDSISFGRGDEADAYRLALAIGSNRGTKPFTQEDLEEIATYLYHDRDWSMAEVGRALKLDVMSVSRALKRTRQRLRLTGVKRNRGGRGNAALTPEQEDEILRLREHEDISYEKIAERLGISKRTIIEGEKRARQRRKEKEIEKVQQAGEAAKSKAEPEPEPESIDNDDVKSAVFAQKPHPMPSSEDQQPEKATDKYEVMSPQAQPEQKESEKKAASEGEPEKETAPTHAPEPAKEPESSNSTPNPVPAPQPKRKPKPEPKPEPRPDSPEARASMIIHERGYAFAIEVAERILELCRVKVY